MVIYLLLIFYLSIASAMDVCWRKIDNSWILYGLVSGLVLSFLDAGLYGNGGCSLELGSAGIISSIRGMLYPLPLIILYGLHLLGAGDIKLLMVCGAFLGINNLKSCLIPMAFSAGVAAIFFTIKNNWRLFTVRETKGHYIPLAPAIFLGVVIQYICECNLKG